MSKEKSYKHCVRCGTSVDLFTWVHHFRNAHFLGCPKCHMISNLQEKNYNQPLNSEREKRKQ